MVTPEVLADLRKKAEAAKDIDPANYYPGQTPSEYVAHTKAAMPATVLALLDRIAELEAINRDALAALKRANDGLRALQAMDKAIEQQRALEASGTRGDHQ